MKKYLELFITMFKIGLFTFGGGYAMIALLQNEFVERKKWIDKDSFLDMVTISESTPGPIAINAATYLGYRHLGFLGALIASVSVCIPSFVIIFIISLFFEKFLALKYVEYAFRGIQCGIILLILSAGIRMFKQLEKSWFNIAVFSVTFILMITFSLIGFSFSSIYYILLSGLAGLLSYLIPKIRKKEEKK